jgi:hypothetical protein
MRSIFTRSFLGAALTALLAGTIASSWATDAHAQAAFYNKRVPITFVRNSNAGDNPFVAGDPTHTSYTTSLSNGTHGTLTPTAGVSITAANGVLACTDTTDKIDVRDHWARALANYIQMPVVASALLAESLQFGTLTLQSNSATVDSFMVLKDVSNDGFTWSAVDSVSFHCISDNTEIDTGRDSAQFIGTAIANSAGTTGFKASVTFTANPWFTKSGVTAQALVGVNFVRFRLHMTYTDYATAGASKGFTAEFVFPSVDSNPNLLNRAVPYP